MALTSTTNFITDVFYTEKEFAFAHKKALSDKINYSTFGEVLTVLSASSLVEGYFVNFVGNENFTVNSNTMFLQIKIPYDENSADDETQITGIATLELNSSNYITTTTFFYKTIAIVYKDENNQVNIVEENKLSIESFGKYYSLASLRLSDNPSMALINFTLKMGNELEFIVKGTSDFNVANGHSATHTDVGYYKWYIKKSQVDNLEIKVTKYSDENFNKNVFNFVINGYFDDSITWTIPDQWLSFEMDYVAYGNNGNLQSYCKGIPWALINKVRGEFERNGVTMSTIAIKNSTSTSSTRWTGFFGTSNMFLSGTRYLLSIEFARRATDYLLSFNCYSVALTNGSINISNQSRITAVCVCDIDATVTQN